MLFWHFRWLGVSSPYSQIRGRSGLCIARMMHFFATTTAELAVESGKKSAVTEVQKGCTREPRTGERVGAAKPGARKGTIRQE